MRKKQKPKCPICKQPATDGFKPFCSDRCKNIDLNRWLSDSYAIPASSEEQDPEELIAQMIQSQEQH
nr:DNA gyrase inhibitor YacG [Pseudovibrio stylochi]